MSVMKHITRRLRRFARSERGGPMVEFAIILPILMILFAGATEVGRLFYTYTTLAKATKVGARFLSTQAPNTCYQFNGSSCPSNCAICNQARNLVVCGYVAGCGGGGQPSPIVKNLTAANVSITNPAGSNTSVEVSITGYTYQPLIFNFSRLAGTQASWANLTLNPSTKVQYMR